ncbi:F-box/kelch-repeat protein At3g06240-like [Rutidosis leptorrhynchoides]|uniref:F-box/kelch-repeat protein At3g06240-like n=1 Tax=Rutidosis leptorrhynchoides TaxID=125765 RepID=UPI003A9A159B
MNDVLEEILSRLDVEDVLRCKCVCKSWYNLISSSYFVKAHLERSYNKKREHGCFRVFLRLDDFSHVGSCDGLVCIYPIRGEFVVTNPSTREVRKLPRTSMKYREKVCWGFGYDSSTDDYKVVIGYNQSEHHTCFKVLSLKSNKWKFIGDDHYSSPFNYHHGILYDGALHWFVDDTKKKKRIILSFDLSLEKFKEIPKPDDTKYVCDNRNRLGMFEERLCIYRSYSMYNRCYQTIWVMKNYNCWQLLPPDYEGNKCGAATTACALERFPDNTWRLCGYGKGYVSLWKSWYYVTSPIFVKSLVSPYLCEQPNIQKNNKRKRKAYIQGER